MAVPLEDRVPKIPFLLMACVATVGVLYVLIGHGLVSAFYGALLALIFVACLFSIRISLALLSFSMLLSPEIGMGSTASRDVTLRLEDLLLFVMTLGWVLRMAFFKDVGFALKNKLNVPILAYSVIIAISTGMGIGRGNVDPLSGSFFALKVIEYFFLFNVIVNYVQDEKQASGLLTTLLITCGFICLYSLFQALTGGAIEAPFEGGNGERNTLSGYLVLMGSVAAGVMIKTRSSFERILIGAMLPLLVVVLMYSISRSGWISSVVALFVLFLNTNQKRVFFILIVGIMIVLPLVAPKVVEDRIDYTFHQGFYPEEQVVILGVRLDTSTSARIISAQQVMNEFIDYPFFGRGMTGWRFLDGQFFRVLIELGVFGLAAFGWLLATVHWFISRAKRLDLAPRLQGMVLGYQAGFWALLAHALTANTFIIVRISEPFWFLAGLTVVCCMSREHSHLDQEEESLKISRNPADYPRGVVPAK